jgi:hypothetical protein
LERYYLLLDTRANTLSCSFGKIVEFQIEETRGRRPNNSGMRTIFPSGSSVLGLIAGGLTLIWIIR